MVASRRLQPLLSALKVSDNGKDHLSEAQNGKTSSSQAQVFCGEHPSCFDETKTDGYGRITSPKSSGASSSLDLWEDSSGLCPVDRKDENLELFQAGFSDMVQQLNASHARIVSLEKEVKTLEEEKLKQEYRYHLNVIRLNDQIRILEHKAEIDMEELKRRQDQIETEVPSLEEEIRSLKDALHDLNISESLYSELVVLPKESRTVREHILVLAYERMQTFHQDLQTARQERDMSREALSRANDEVQRLRREMQSNATVDAIEQHNKDREMEALRARNERLEKELQDTNLQLQVLSAKGALYDEVRCKLVGLEELLLSKEKEKTDLSKNLQISAKEKAQCEDLLKEKLHCIELLQMEKAYINGQHKAQEEQLKKVETEKKEQQEKIDELEQARQGLYNRVLSNEEVAQAAREQLLHEDKLRLQEKSKEELDLLRQQLTEAANFEIVMLTKSRDIAVSECERVRAALQESRAENEQLMKKFQEVRLASIRSVTSEEDAASKRERELMKTQEDTYHLLCQAKIENEVLTKKLENVAQNLLEAENDMGKDLIQLRLNLQNANATVKQYQADEQLLNEALLRTSKDCFGEAIVGETGAIYSVQGKLDMIASILKRCTSLRQNIKTMEEEREALRQQISEIEEKVDESSKKIECMNEPTSALADKIQDMQKSLKRELEAKEAVSKRLREAILAKNKASHALHSLRKDVKRVLEARGNMATLQQILMEKNPNLGNIVIVSTKQGS